VKPGDSAEPLTREERDDLMHAAELWEDGQPDAPVSRISTGRTMRRYEATVQAAEARAERAEALVEWYAQNLDHKNASARAYFNEDSGRTRHC
jgi:hypothetical protein